MQGEQKAAFEMISHPTMNLSEQNEISHQAKYRSAWEKHRTWSDKKQDPE